MPLPASNSCQRKSLARDRLRAAQAGDPGALAGQRALQRLDLAERAASACAARRCRRSVDAVAARRNFRTAAVRRASRRRSAAVALALHGRSERSVSVRQPAGVEREDADDRRVLRRSGRSAPCPRRRSWWQTPRADVARRYRVEQLLRWLGEFFAATSQHPSRSLCARPLGGA